VQPALFPVLEPRPKHQLVVVVVEAIFLTGLGAAGTAAMGFAKLLPLLGLSDEREKTDIKKIGKDKESGLTMYSYRYKGDPKSYPKVTGPMAQEV